MYLKHGLSNTPEYKCWQQIKARCMNSNHRAYLDYGGRGVTIFDGWVKDFRAFLAHVGPRPSDGHSLDRYPNLNGNYEPGNVRWATDKEQNNNRRPHRKHGVKLCSRPVRTDGKPTNFKHGGVGTPEYRAWSLMKAVRAVSDPYGPPAYPMVDPFDPFSRAVGDRNMAVAAYDQARLVSPAYTFRTRVAGERARAMREARERAGASCP